jgi:hypothetical protein
MSRSTSSSVMIQTSARSVPAPPSWFGEVTLIASWLARQGVLATITEQVRFARRRFGRYEVIDFVAVLFGYAISGERTLEAFYGRLRTNAAAFMALFGRDRLPSRSALSRFLATLTAEPVEALRSLFLSDLLARPLDQAGQVGGLWDRVGTQWLVFDVDGTRETARQRALPQTPDRPVAQRRLRPLCAPGYLGRKRGEVVRTRTTVSQTHSYQWLGSFGNPGNGLYREELRRAAVVIQCYLAAHQIPPVRALLRLDGQYSTAAVLADLVGLSFVMRGKGYQLLDRPEVQARLHLPPDQQFARPESGVTRTLYDCPDLPLGLAGHRCRVVVATHPATEKKRRVGIERGGLVYELFLTNLPQSVFTASGVVGLYLHRGAFETALADEDREQDPDRWCSHSAWGQECWQIVSQWVWNLRLELGHHLEPTSPRTTELAPALPPVKEQAADSPAPAPGYGPPVTATSWKAGRFSGKDFAFQSDGTLRCPAGKTLHPTEQRTEDDGSLRVLYAARIVDCRVCLVRAQCQWRGHQTTKPRRVSLLWHPSAVGSASLLWWDWSRRVHRRACMRLLRGQRLEVQMELARSVSPTVPPAPLSRAQRAHYRLSWEERLARNARASAAGLVTIRLFGVPAVFATALGLATA